MSEELWPKQDTHEAVRHESERRRRRHGYRGYPNNSAGAGAVHWGSGFSGVGSLRSASIVSSATGVLTERTKQDAARRARADEGSE